jgi:hypothetical protein
METIFSISMKILDLAKYYLSLNSQIRKDQNRSSLLHTRKSSQTNVFLRSNCHTVSNRLDIGNINQAWVIKHIYLPLRFLSLASS